MSTGNLCDSQRRKFYLLSPIIPENDEGDYSVPFGLCLTYNEAYRREIARLLRALPNIDPLEHPWKCIALYRWLRDFFIPVVRHHLNSKRNFSKPHYENLGYTIPTSLEYSSEFLVQEFADILRVAFELVELSTSADHFPKKIKATLHILQSLINHMTDLLQQQLNEEEKFWPAVLEETGVKEFNTVLSKQLVHNRRHAASTSNNVFALVFFAVGYQLKANQMYEEMDALDIPWCGPKTRMLIVKRSPYIVKALPLVHWMKTYLTFQRLINSTLQDQDVLDVLRDHQRSLQRHMRAQQHTLFSRLFSCFDSSDDVSSDGSDRQTPSKHSQSFGPSHTKYSTTDYASTHVHLNTLQPLPSCSDKSKKGRDCSPDAQDQSVLVFTAEYEAVVQEQLSESARHPGSSPEGGHRKTLQQETSSSTTTSTVPNQLSTPPPARWKLMSAMGFGGNSNNSDELCRTGSNSVNNSVSLSYTSFVTGSFKSSKVTPLPVSKIETTGSSDLATTEAS